MEFDANLKYHTTLVADDEFLLTGALDYIGIYVIAAAFNSPLCSKNYKSLHDYTNQNQSFYKLFFSTFLRKGQSHTSIIKIR